jgi:hypothetical protein
MADTHQQERQAKPARRGPVRKALRWAFRIVAVFLILILFLLHMLPYLTDTGPFRRFAARTLSGRLNGAQVQIRSLQVAPLRPHLLRIEGFSLAPPGQPGEPIVSLDRADCYWRLADLFHGRLHLTSASAGSVHLRIRRQDGRWNFLSILPARGAKPPRALRLPIAVSIDAIRADGVQVELEMAPGIAVTLHDIKATASASFEGALVGAAAADVTGKLEAQLRVAQVKVSQSFRANLRARSPGGLMELSGTFATDEMEMVLARIGALRPAAVGAGFSAQVDLQRLEAPLVEANVQVPQLLSDVMSGSLAAGPEHEFRGENSLALDLTHAAELLPPALSQIAKEVRLAGKVGAFTDFAVRLHSKPAFAATVQATTRASASGLGAGAQLHLPSRKQPGGLDVNVEVEGLDAQLVLDEDSSLGGGASGLARVEFQASMGALGARTGGLSLGAKDLTADGQMELALPRADSMGLSGHARADQVRLSHDRLGSVGTPVDLAFEVSAQDVLDRTAARFAIETAEGSAGALVPQFWCRGWAAGYGRQGFALDGGGELDVAQAVGLLGGLSEPLRARLGEVSAAGTAAGTFGLGGSISGREVSIGLSCGGSALLSGCQARREAFAVSLDGLKSLVMLDLAMETGLMPQEVSADMHADITGFRTELAGKGSRELPLLSLSLAKATAAVSAQASDLASLPLRADGQAAVEGLQLVLAPGAEPKKLSWEPLSLELKGGLETSPLTGDLSIRDLELSVPGLAEMAVPALSLEGFGSSVSGEARMALPDLAAMVRFALSGLSERLAGRRLPSISGKAKAQGSFSGRLPVLQRMVTDLASRRPIPRPGLLPLRAFYENQAPVDFSGQVEFEDVAVGHTLAGGMEIGVSGLAGSASGALKEGRLEGSTDVRVPAVQVSRVPIPLEDFQLSADFTADAFDQVAVRSFRLTGLKEAVQMEGTVLASGLGRLTGLPRPAWLLENLDLDVQSRGTARLDRLGISEPFHVSGQAGWDFGLDLQGGRSLTVTLAGQADDVSAGYASLFSLQGIRGGPQLAKTWRIARAGTSAPGAASLSQELLASPAAPAAPGMEDLLPEFGTAADQMLRAPARVSVDSISALGAELARSAAIEMDMAGEGLSVPRFYLHPLGGKVVGTASYRREADGRRLSLRGDFGQVDFRRMLPPQFRDFGGDAQVDGDFELSVTISGQASQAGSFNPLRDIAARVVVTHIGSSALDRLLLALDPRGANPNFVRLRTALALGSPTRASGSLERGFVALTAEIQAVAGTVVTEYPIPRFSIANLFSARPVALALQKARPLFLALDALDAEEIEVTPEGAVRFR